MKTPYPNLIAPTETRIGWIGIGVMGGAMASRLLSAGYSLTVYARNPSKALSLQSKGAHLAGSPYDVARCSDVVFTMVGHPSDVRSLVLDSNVGILAGLNPGCVVVDTTTSEPALAREIFEAAKGKGCHSVDSPVSGGDIGARDGKLAIFAGGDEGVVKWLSPLYEVLGKVTYMGQAGCGQSCKIANQILVGANLLSLSEGLVFAEKAGLDVRNFVDAVKRGAAGSMVMELFGERMIGRDFKAGGFAEYMVKDMGMCVDFVEENEDERVPVLPGAALGKQLFAGMVANGDTHLGTQGLITVIERLNGNRPHPPPSVQSPTLQPLEEAAAARTSQLHQNSLLHQPPQLGPPMIWKKIATSVRSWTINETEALVSYMEELVVKGYKNGAGQFKPRTFQLLANKMNAKFPECGLTANHVKNKHKRLKEKYQSAANMLNCSGFRWNEERKCVEVDSKQVLDLWLKKNPQRFYTPGKLFPLFHRLKFIFGKDKATGTNIARVDLAAEMGTEDEVGVRLGKKPFTAGPSHIVGSVPVNTPTSMAPISQKEGKLLPKKRKGEDVTAAPSHIVASVPVNTPTPIAPSSQNERKLLPKKREGDDVTTAPSHIIASVPVNTPAAMASPSSQEEGKPLPKKRKGDDVEVLEKMVDIFKLWVEQCGQNVKLIANAISGHTEVKIGEELDNMGFSIDEVVKVMFKFSEKPGYSKVFWGLTDEQKLLFVKTVLDE